MAYVIADPCIAVCDTACVDQCPVDCIHGPAPDAPDAPAQLFIDANECICCGMCEPVCPVNAIFDESVLPAKWADALARRDRFFENFRR